MINNARRKVNDRRVTRLLVVLLILPALGGCCGMTNVQASGGGTGGLASLGVLMLGSEAMKRLCDQETKSEPEDAPLPPDTDQPAESSSAAS